MNDGSGMLSLTRRRTEEIFDGLRRKSFVDTDKPVWDKFANTPELKALVQEIVNAK